MESNFQFLKSLWPDVYAAAADAEKEIYVKPIAAAMYSRQAMELLVNWIYDYDKYYKIPYRNTLAAKLREDCFVADVPRDIRDGLEFIRKTGNLAVHQRKANQIESFSAVVYLFAFCKYVTRTYTDEPYKETFNDDIIPKENPLTMAFREIHQLKKKIDDQTNKIRVQQEAILADEEHASTIESLKENISSIKENNKHIPFPKSEISEDVTRKLFIDVDLKEAGWDLDEANVIEFEINNMPRSTNPTGLGKIDYVLWGDNGLPLAVVEAKRTCRNAEEGKTQAEIYCSCLEELYGQRPVIFYSNGFETWIWDDQFYPPRKLHGFYDKNELQLLINRRTSRKDLRVIDPNPNITGRYYQREALKRVAEAFTTDYDGRLVGKRRKALLVMATGTGKTRVSISMVNMMIKSNWVKRVLFLADRNALVTQAKRAFNEHTPHLTSIDLTREFDDGSTRVVFSTYPTIMNRIDDAKVEDATIYGVGHFDLIIIDEAHRSIYKKYQDIFEYFDALQVGLTATPRDETDKDTYDAFDCEVGNPTYYYELNQAVQDKYLVPPKKVSVGTSFMRRGIKYSELSEDEQKKYEETFQSEEEMPDEINADAINKWLFNKNTIVQVLNVLMEHGIKVKSGDEIGKTIIFARNQEHADLIEKVFDQQFPQYSGHFIRSVTYKDKYAQDTIDRFKIDNRNPRIAVSVDMLDTGIDVPSIVNLVFFKPVYSKSKFWQMIGRGTRLCEDLYGPGEDKEDFLIFDYCQNFEFFDINPDGRTSNAQISISHRIYSLKLNLAEALRDPDYYSEENIQYRIQLLDESHGEVENLLAMKNNFRIKMRIPHLDKFKERSRWDNLSKLDLKEISDYIAPLVIYDDPDEKAKIFDALMYKMQLGLLNGDPSFDTGRVNLIRRARALSTISNIPVVKEKLPLINAIQSDSYWEEINLPSLEHVRTELRDLMHLVYRKPKNKVVTDFKDKIIEIEDAEFIFLPKAPDNYLLKVEEYIRTHQDYLVINKLKNNIPITSDELDQLEQFLFDGKERGSADDFYKTAYEKNTLGVFIRSIIGMDRKAALEVFSDFMENKSLTAAQSTFIKNIIDHLEINGVIDPGQLYEQPFTDIHALGIDGLFPQEGGKIIDLINQVMANAVVNV